jgi:16S rRNA (guanine1207-N2)-methyltransferase
MDRRLAWRDRANRMLDTYGSLLTAQQRQLLARYYRDDLSLGEIAEQMRVTRQAVHDGLRRALAAMERFETALGLVGAARFARAPAPPEHYYTARPRSRARSRQFTALLRGRSWTFETASGVFAHRGLDAGTRLLIDAMRVGRADRVLDLGCGYGPLGVVAAGLATRGRVWLVDANRRAAALALTNVRRNRLRNARVLVGDGATAVASGSMDLVLTNPPIRAGRGVVRGFLEGAWRVLRPGGRFYLVARTAQGAKTLAQLIGGRFGDVRQVAARGGYRVYEARRSTPGEQPTEEAGSV